VVEEIQRVTGVVPERIAGTDRFDTAAALARQRPGKHVLLATGTDFPDGLAGTPLAGRTGPLLLTLPTALPAATAEALQELAPTTITVLGGPGAVSEEVASRVRG
jgi:putative cell wall-binding protein